MSDIFRILGSAVVGIAVGWVISMLLQNEFQTIDRSNSADSGATPTLLDGRSVRYPVERWHEISGVESYEERLKILNSTQWFRGKAKAFTDLFTEIAEEDVEKAVSLAHAVNGRANSRQAWDAILEVVSATSFEEAILIAEEHRFELLEGVMEKWAEQKPVEAIEYLGDSDYHILDNGLHNNLVNEALHSWGRSDLAAATEWLLKSTEDIGYSNKARLLAGLFSEHAKDQPERVMALAKDHLGGEDQLLIITKAMGAWAASTDAIAIADWSRELEDPLFRGMVQETLVKTLASSSPDVAAGLIKDIPGSDSQLKASVTLAFQKAENQGIEAAAEWLESVSDPVVRNQAIAGFAVRWGAKNPDQATEFIKYQNLPPERERVFYRKLGAKLVLSNFPLGRDWVAELAPEMRSDIVAEIRESGKAGMLTPERIAEIAGE